MIVAEILEKSGRVHERIRLTQFPVSIGRGYGNDIILDDDFVSPAHARIELDEEGQPVVVDLDSENGTFVLPALEKLQRRRLGEETLLRLGHTLIRLRSADYAVPRTRHDSLGMNRASHWLASGAGAALSLGIVALLVLLEGYQTSTQFVKPEQLLLNALPVVLAIPVWAGLWALVSRSFAHHTFFLAHLTIASLGVIGFFLLDTAAEYYAFAFAADMSADVIFQGAAGLVAAAMLYGHLRFSTLLTPRVVATASVLVAASLLGLSTFTAYVEGLQFNDDLPYPGELKPPMFRLAKSRTPAQFAEDAKALQEVLDSGQLD